MRRMRSEALKDCRYRRIGPWLLAIGLLVTIGCPKGSPGDQIAKQRTQYTVKLNSWQPQPTAVEEPPPPAEPAAAVASAMEAAVAAEAVEGEEADEGEIVFEEEIVLENETTNVLFDLLVRFEGSDPLPGITVDITHADGSETNKDVRRHWIDTSDFRNKETKQVDFVLEDFEFVEGDLFSVELRPFVPAEERSDYREFSGGN